MPEVKRQAKEATDKEIIEHVTQWVASTEGQAKIMASQKAALETVKKLRRARKLDPRILVRPRNI